MPRGCDMCGYSLRGLAASGTCPECGTQYTERSPFGLKGWRYLLVLLARLSWPIIGVAAAVTYMFMKADGSIQPPDWLLLPVIVAGMILAVIVPLNCYRQVNRFFTRCLPPRSQRRTGLVMLRWIGTLGCIVGGLALVLAYAALAFLLNVNVMHP